jgi:plasmid stabilization system protein ParE
VPHLEFTADARAGLQRCRRFLTQINPTAAQRARRVIEKHLSLLTATPEIGRPALERPGYRELIISFGDSGYVALYRYVRNSDAVVIVAFKHQRELDFFSG